MMSTLYTMGIKIRPYMLHSLNSQLSFSCFMQLQALGTQTTACGTKIALVMDVGWLEGGFATISRTKTFVIKRRPVYEGSYNLQRKAARFRINEFDQTLSGMVQFYTYHSLNSIVNAWICLLSVILQSCLCFTSVRHCCNRCEPPMHTCALHFNQHS